MRRLEARKFLLVVFLACQCLATARKREKRFLHFPAKTNVVLTMSLLKLLPTESIANTLTEMDMIVPLPLHPYEKGLHPRQKRELERNVIFSSLKDTADHFGFDGNACLRKFICELHQSIPPSTENKDNLLRDIVDIIFAPNITVPEGCMREMANTCRIF